MWAGPHPMYWKVLLGGGGWAGPSPMYWDVVHGGLATSHVLGGGKCGAALVLGLRCITTGCCTSVGYRWCRTGAWCSTGKGAEVHHHRVLH